MTLLLEVPTPLGPGRWHIDAAPEPVATLLLGHGAGGGVTAMDLDLLARKLPAEGVTVMRYEQPWRVAGRKVATPPPQLDIGWRGGVDALAADGLLTDVLFFGGRSAGARVACRTAPDYPVAGVVCLAFPLHLPGRPEKSRAAELLTPTVPRLVLQGSKDTFGGPDEIRAATAGDPGVVLVELPGADHGYRTAKAAPFTPADLRARLLASVADFIGIPVDPAG
ncbi:alpha/beta hydrolase family protein [Microlunatus ginsengisoli]|uniref:KANL3/Tex30 alpha/beta hydrolase-like domain-containing protein n=1 Tax=Microlunatus ginsengisoli TaxID=363863 RepID=A0ABP6ZWQ5_9ACTN